MTKIQLHSEPYLSLFPVAQSPPPPLNVCLGPHSFCFPDRSKALLLRVLTIYESDAATMAPVEDIAKYYADDLPSPATLQQELQLWHSRWKCVEKRDLPSTPSGHQQGYVPQHSYSSVCIICTLPVTSCEYKCLLCCAALTPTTMGGERMTGLALMHIHYGMELNLDEIINICR